MTTWPTRNVLSAHVAAYGIVPYCWCRDETGWVPCLTREQAKPTGNVRVQGDVTYDADSRIATFDRSKNLAKGLYMATLTGVADEAGNVMPDYTWTFTTVGPSKK